jgi:hypothetical protein
MTDVKDLPKFWIELYKSQDSEWLLWEGEIGGKTYFIKMDENRSTNNYPDVVFRVKLHTSKSDVDKRDWAVVVAGIREKTWQYGPYLSWFAMIDEKPYFINIYENKGKDPERVYENLLKFQEAPPKEEKEEEEEDLGQPF